MLKIIKTTPELLYKAQNDLPESYIKLQEKKPTYIESLIARFMIFENDKFLAQTNKKGVPEFIGNKFWSISHKENLVFVATSQSPIGVDIEVVQERGPEVYEIHKSEEYNIFGEKNMMVFYLLWVLKESVIKLCLSELEEIKNIKIDAIHDFSKHIEGVKFQFKFFATFNGRKIVGYLGIEENKVYAMSYFL